MIENTNLPNIEDQRLIEAFLEPSTRDEACLNIVKRHQETLYWHIRRLVVAHEDAEDMLQETFSKAFLHLHKFKGNSSLKTWLYKIATNECLSHLKKKKNRFYIMGDLTTAMVDRLKTETTLDDQEIEVRFQEAILRLPPQQQLVFQMRYYDDLSYEEIKEITGSSIATLKTNYHYAFHKLKAILIE
jgi:RNA polymerase sigma-70 factor, ECF subfamily